jgi:predicted ferric reductase
MGPVRLIYHIVFYTIHVILSAFILIVVALHRPDFSGRAIIITLFAASLSFMDRAIRAFKFSCNFMGNHAALTALPNGATRVTLRQSSKATPGSHAFLWLPPIRFVETHPFTLVSSNPAEFVVSSRDGFTSALHQYAKEFPGKTLRCSLNTGYGKLPDFKSYDSILLIAGGSGASFTFAVALDLSRNPGPSTSGSITFVWVIRDKGKTANQDCILQTPADSAQLLFHGLTRNFVNSS